MAGDSFTQIANALFRDRRISFKAKGIFGLVSTHRDGWRVSVNELARLGPDGRDSVRAGLAELEKFGYLVRERERRSDGTLGEAVYSITDMPAHLFELYGDDAPELPKKPTAARQARKTPASKSTARQPALDEDQEEPETAKTDSVSVPMAETEAPKAPLSTPSAASAAGRAAAPSAGVTLLLEIGNMEPRLQVGGPALRDQGARLEALLAAGWSADALRTAVVGNLTVKPISNPGGYVSRRIDVIPAAPVPVPAQAAAPFAEEGSTASSPHDRQPSEAVRRRVQHECPGTPQEGFCGNPVIGEDELCRTCLGWVRCTACARLARPGAPGGRCQDCCVVAEQFEQESAEAERVVLSVVALGSAS
jgi:hypothetical protein